MELGKRWEIEKLYLDTAGFFGALVREIDQAQKSIDVEMYIFQYDYVGRNLIKSLQAAAKRGVQIRVLVDAVGSAAFASVLAKEFFRSGIEFRDYHSFTGGKILQFFRVVNRRNHRKSWIFDGQRAYISSGNVMESDWKEAGIMVAGPELATLFLAFEEAWEQKKIFKKGIHLKSLFSTIRKNHVSLLRLNNSLVSRFGNYRDFIRRTKRATQRVWLGNAYFVPRYGLVRTLLVAARGGVDVRLLLSHRSDVFFMPWLAKTYYLSLLKAGVKIYEYMPSVYHSKIRIIDDWMILGSTNLNHRSLLHDLEIDVQLTDPANRKLLVAEMEQDFSRSKVIGLEDLKKISIFQSWVARFVLLFRNWV
jgi:cardiolipin synthase